MIAILEKLAARESAAWKPRPRLSTADWCHRHLRLPTATSASPGRYDLRRYPYWRGVLEAADDPAVEEISIQAATQVGKTTLLMAFLGSRPYVQPGPAMLATPDIGSCRELRDKFYRMCEATKPLAAIIPPPYRRNDQWIDFGNMLCHLAWSGNPQRLSAKSCEYVLGTEIDRWQQSVHEGPTQRLILERVKAFFHFKIILESTPSDDASPIAACYDRSDRRLYLVPCPRCGHHQELRFFLHKEGEFTGHGGVAGLQHPNGEWLSVDEARALAHYLCEKGCRIESDEKPWMVSRGVWCPRGQSVSKAGKLIGQPGRSPRHAGFQLNSLYAETVDFGRIAAAYLESRDNQQDLQAFWNNWLALRWVTTGKAPRWQRVARRLAGNHRRGIVPASAFFLTAGIDTQDDCVYWTARAWGEGCTSWLVDWGKLTMRYDAEGAALAMSDFDQLDEVLLNREFPLAATNPAGREKLRVRLACVDYQGHRAWEVAGWVRERNLRGVERIRVIAGDTRLPAGEFYRMSIVDRHAGTGKRYPGGLKRWAVEVDSYKADVQARFEAPLDKPGAWFLPEGIAEEGTDYLRQICNEARRQTRDKKGRQKTEWVVVDHRLGEHYWDCEIYARAGADMVTGQDWRNLLRRAGPAPTPAGQGGKDAAREKQAKRGQESSARQQSSPYGRTR